MESFKAFNLTGVDLKKKFKDVRRRTTQKVHHLCEKEPNRQTFKYDFDFKHRWLNRWASPTLFRATKRLHTTIDTTFGSATILKSSSENFCLFVIVIDFVLLL
jgi:hypothetical protein